MLTTARAPWRGRIGVLPLPVVLKRVRPEQNPAQTQRVHPNDQPLPVTHQVIDEHLNWTACKGLLSY